jgi:phosphate transport system substrate-binding protein
VKLHLTRNWMALAVALGAALFMLPVTAQDGMDTTGIRGAGSTFAFPLISRWSREYRIAMAGGGDFPTFKSGLEDPPSSNALEYEPVGSLAGTQRLRAGAVDFAASDVPLKSEELAKLGFAQFPLAIGGVVAVVNINGVGPGEMKFTGPVLADIFQGKITNWSDPVIKVLNPDLKMPEATIVVIRRSDGSGTTFNFTDYLSKVSPAWKEKVGSDLSVSWPVGRGVRGNEGVSRTVRQTPNSIGYVDLANAVQFRLSFAQIQNQAGKFIRPDAGSFQAAAASAQWGAAGDFYVLLTNAPGVNAYPIVATVFALMPKKASAKRARTALDFFQWSLERGAKDASQLGYVPLPPELVTQVKGYWSTNFKPGS